jgi:hypothetical protein
LHREIKENNQQYLGGEKIVKIREIKNYFARFTIQIEGKCCLSGIETFLGYKTR